MTIKPANSPWFWFIVGMAISGLAIAIYGLFNPKREVALSAAWLTGWAAVGGVLLLVSFFRGYLP